MQVLQDQRLAGKTALIAGADCAIGHAVAWALAHQGARGVLVGGDEQALRQTVKAAPDHLDHLVLDVLRPRSCRLLGAEWGDEPLDVLIHVQALAVPARPGAVIAAIPALTRALVTGLRAADFPRVVIVCVAPFAQAQAEAWAYDRAMQHLPQALQQEFAWQDGPPGQGAVNAVRVSNVSMLQTQCGQASLAQTLLWLCQPQARTVSGAVLPVDLPCD
ncbi:MAG TPA: hypothetical protein VJ929_03655 [Roseovarius sp.]|nr:hypothetical protein [Roseovarius sp.]